MKRTICVNFVSVVELLSHVRLKEPLDCSLPGPSVHGVLQARILEWVASSSSRGTSSPRDWTGVSCLGRWILYHWATREALPWPKTFLSEKESFGSHFLWCIRCWWESSTRQWAAVNAVWYSVGWNINIQGSTRLQTDSHLLSPPYSILNLAARVILFNYKLCCMLSHVRLFATLMDCSLPGSSVHGILQARILAWVAMPSSRGSSQPRGRTCISYIPCIGRQVFYH